MRRAAVLLCACDQVYGIQNTQPVDAKHEFFDAPTDAPFACPPIGTQPVFSPLVHQVTVRLCHG